MDGAESLSMDIIIEKESTPSDITQLSLRYPPTPPSNDADSYGPLAIDPLLSLVSSSNGPKLSGNSTLQLSRVNELSLDQLHCDPQVLLVQLQRVQRERDAAIQERDFKESQLAESTSDRDKIALRYHQLFTLLRALANERTKMSEKMEWISRFQESGRKAKAYIQRLQETNKGHEEEIERLRSRCIEVVDERDTLTKELDAARSRLGNLARWVETLTAERETCKVLAAEAAHRLIKSLEEPKNGESSRQEVETIPVDRDAKVVQLEELLEQAQQDLEDAKYRNATMVTGLLAERKRSELERKLMEKELLELRQLVTATVKENSDLGAITIEQDVAPISPATHRIDHVLVPPAPYQRRSPSSPPRSKRSPSPLDELDPKRRKTIDD